MGKYKDLIGQKFGKLTVIYLDEERKFINYSVDNIATEEQRKLLLFTYIRGEVTLAPTKE